MSQFDVASSVQGANQPTSQAGRRGLSGRSIRIMLRDHATLVAELHQAHGLNQHRIKRITELELALDQALSCLSDFRQQLGDQEMLETQLAKTENFANVQQKALLQLKRQINDKNQILEAQAFEIHARDQAVHELQTTLEAQQQQQEQQQRQMADLEAQLEQAETQIQQLTKALQIQQAERVQAQQQVEQLQASLDQQQTLELALRRAQTLVAERHTSITALQKELAIAQIRIEELDAQLAQLGRGQARWQHQCQEAEAERDRHQSRIRQLEQQSDDLQEQVFRQAEAASEYETAVQHWKDRYAASQQQLAYFQELVNQAFPGQSADANFGTHLPITPALLELLTAIQMAQVHPGSELLPAVEGSLVRAGSRYPHDIPEFLAKRRHRLRWEPQPNEGLCGK